MSEWAGVTWPARKRTCQELKHTFSIIEGLDNAMGRKTNTMMGSLIAACHPRMNAMQVPQLCKVASPQAPVDIFLRAPVGHFGRHVLLKSSWAGFVHAVFEKARVAEW